MTSGLLTTLIIVGLLIFLWWFLGINYLMVTSFAGAPISIYQIIGMRIRGTKVKYVVNAYVTLRRARVDIRVTEIEVILLAKQNLDNIVDGLLTAKRNNIPMTFKQALESDKKGTKISTELLKNLQAND